MSFLLHGTESTEEKARKYAHIKHLLAFVHIGYSLILLLIFSASGLSKFLAQKTALWGNLFCLPGYLLIASLLYALFEFPINFYGSFLLEHAFSLSTERFQGWCIDQLKSGVIGYIIALILFSLFYMIVKSNPFTWWLIVSFVWILFSVILARLTPTLIIPLFFKSTPLPDEALRTRVLVLASRMKVKLLDVFEIDFSKKTVKANAAFVGWGKSRRVLLADTLKNKYTHDEIEVILAHEFAHYTLHHLFKLIAANALVTLGAFYLIFKTSGPLVSFFGFSSIGHIEALPIVILYFSLFGFLMQPLENYLSRRFERDADLMALKVAGDRRAFISMMNKLAEQNLADKNPHPFIKFIFFDHPPISERIAFAENYPLSGTPPS